jgi:aquaporin Z
MRRTGALAATLVALFILVEAPVSGMSMNPARTFASALAANDWSAFWIYLTAPPLAMLAAVEAYRLELRARGRAPAGCAKLDHDPRVRCVFCGLDPARATSPGTSPAPASLSMDSRPS